VQQSDIEQSYAENRSAFGAMSEDEAKERIRLDLESHARMQNYRAALSKLEQSSHIELNLEEPALPLVNVVEENAPALGGKEAAVTIIEFSDFQCTFCKQSQSTMQKVLQAYGNNVRLVFKHLPLEMHPDALPSARAAFCAGEPNFFWQYHDALFTSANLSLEALNKIATELGLDLPRFKTCFESDLSRTAVLRDVQEARRLGIAATPTFIVNGTLMRGAHNFDDFKGIIELKLKNSQPTITQR
jgi:protein-disulfide isomerase